MIIKDEIANLIVSILNESMSRRQFREAIKGEDFDERLMNRCLDLWSSNKKIKNSFILNDYVDKPNEFINNTIEFVRKYEIQQIEKEYFEDMSSKYVLVHEDDRIAFYASFSPEANRKLSHKLHRLKGDGKSFGSGPTWCIADDMNAELNWEVYGFDTANYPSVFILIDKHNSRNRFQITYNPEQRDGEYEIKDIHQVRDFTQSEENVPTLKRIEKTFNIKYSDIRKWILDKIDVLQEYMNEYNETTIEDRDIKNYKIAKTILYGTEYEDRTIDDDLVEIFGELYYEISRKQERADVWKRYKSAILAIIFAGVDYISRPVNLIEQYINIFNDYDIDINDFCKIFDFCISFHSFDDDNIQYFYFAYHICIKASYKEIINSFENRLEYYFRGVFGDSEPFLNIIKYLKIHPDADKSILYLILWVINGIEGRIHDELETIIDCYEEIDTNNITKFKSNYLSYLNFVILKLFNKKKINKDYRFVKSFVLSCLYDVKTEMTDSCIEYFHDIILDLIKERDFVSCTLLSPYKKIAHKANQIIYKALNYLNDEAIDNFFDENPEIAKILN